MFIVFQGGSILKPILFFESSKRARIKNKSEYNQFITNCQINILFSSETLLIFWTTVAYPSLQHINSDLILGASMNICFVSVVLQSGTKSKIWSLI
jgi:hypothetical protein